MLIRNFVKNSLVTILLLYTNMLKAAAELRSMAALKVFKYPTGSCKEDVIPVARRLHL